jgi:hypothetical protein
LDVKHRLIASNSAVMPAKAGHPAPSKLSHIFHRPGKAAQLEVLDRPPARAMTAENAALTAENI